MITIRQYHLLSELKEDESQYIIIEKDRVQKSLKGKYGANKFSDEVIQAEIQQLELRRFVSSSDSVWMEVTPVGNLLVTEFWKYFWLEKITFVLLNVLLPILLSFITAIITIA